MAGSLEGLTQGRAVMTDYQKLYTKPFNAITDGLEELERLNVGQARDILRRARQEAEEQYLDSEA